MTKQAVVVSVDGSLKAEIIRSEACAQCRACEIGQKERVLCELPEGNWNEGDIVTLTLPDRAFTRAALIAYGVPLIALLIGLIVGKLLFESESLQFVSALVFTFLGLVYLIITEKKRKNSGAYECTAEKIDK